MKFLHPLLVFCALCATLYTLQAQNEAPDQTLSPYFIVKSNSGLTGNMPLTATSAKVNIAGVIADVMVEQTYVNTGSVPLEAIYVFPGSTRAAVYGMGMQIGNRIITAKIAERQQARETYEAAKAEGKRASLLEQERPNVFQMNVANIMPHDTIKVTLRYTELLIPEGGLYQFVYPTVVGPRYTNGQEANNNGFTAMPYGHAGKAPLYTFNLSVHLETGMPLQEVYSTSHRVQVAQPGTGRADIRLDASEQNGGNRDFILKYALRGKQVETGLLLFDDGGEKYFLCMAQPPKQPVANQIPPREYVFVLDVSGSMGGYPLDVAKNLLRNLVAGLRSDDYFNILLFAGGSEQLAPASLQANQANIERAIHFLNNRNGGGGTELLPALKTAMALPRHLESVARSIVLITDGYVGVEQEAFDLVRNNLDQSNLFAFGIGSSVNRFLIEGLAHAGQGAPFIVTESQEANAEAEKFRQYITTPVLTRVKARFEGFEAYEVEPITLPDVMADRPVILFGKWRGNAGGKIVLSGYSGEQETTWGNMFSHYWNKWFNPAANHAITIEVPVAQAASNPENAALKYLWAREKIRRLADFTEIGLTEEQKTEVTQLGLNYNLLTAYTSFVAVEERPANDRPGDLKTVKQELPMPENVSNLAVGFDMSWNGVSDFTTPEGNSAWLIGIMTLVALLAAAIWRYGKKARPLTAILLIVAAASLTGCGQFQADPGTSTQVTFLLGEDRSGRNPYFAQAGAYFRAQAAAGEQVVSSCGSLVEVRDYLHRHRPQEGPWRRINLVVHGNQWTGMNFPAGPGVPRATAAALQALAKDRTFLPLSNRVADSATQILLYGCNLGKDTALLRALATAFGGTDGNCPIVYSAPYFNLFETPTGQPEASTWMLADNKFVAFPAGTFPGNKALEKQFEAAYPADTTNWREVLNRVKPRYTGDSYVHYFTIPIEWTFVYPDEATRPALPGPGNQIEWVKQQKVLAEQLAGTGLDVPQFTWNIRYEDFSRKNGDIRPAIRVEGLCRIYCIVQPLLEKRNGEIVAVQPEIGDRRYFASR